VKFYETKTARMHLVPNKSDFFCSLLQNVHGFDPRFNKAALHKVPEYIFGI